MSTSHNTCQTTRDGLGRFTSTDPKDAGIPQPPQPHSTTASARPDTPFDTSPFAFMATDLDAQRKEDSPDVGNISEPDNFTDPAALTHNNPPTPPTAADDLIMRLVQALATMGQGVTAPAPPTPPAAATPPTNPSRLRTPDAFDGSNPEDLRPFLLQCQLTFNAYPHQYTTDSAKVFFAISYLKKSALEWFENGVMEQNPLRAPAWRTNWTDFMIELRTHFGPINPVRNAEIELNRLTMSSDARLSEYLVRFNTLASRVAWGDAALVFKFYDGLPDRLKDRIAQQGQPDTLRELIQVTARHDTLFWDRQTEQQSNRRLDQRPTFLRPPPTPQYRTTTTQPSPATTTTTSARSNPPRF